MKQFIITLCFLMVAMPALYAADTPVTYQKQKLVLHPKQSDNPEYANGVLLEVDVKQAGSSDNPDWLQLKGYPPGTGLLEIYATNTPLSITPNSMMAAVDVIAIGEYGNVLMIAPNLILGTLNQPIERGDMVKAFLYTQAGLAETIGLQIGDEVEYKLFKKPPVVVDEQTTQEATNAPPTDTEAKPVTTKDQQANTTKAGTNNLSTRRRPMANPVLAEPTQPARAP